MKGELELMFKVEEKDRAALVKSSLQEVDNLSGIVQEMLLLARVDAGMGALNLQDLSLDEMIFEALARSEKLARSKEIKLKFDIENEGNTDAKLVRGDKDLLENLIFNIIENAIKYSPKGETVNLCLIWKPNSSVFVVEDNGPGIPEEQLPYIFERFSRGSETKVKGFGLGLAIANKIAILHNASLRAETIAGHGARFTFEIKNI
ncbi:Phosphate regulon sensor protein PhoR [compost metagenome]